MTMNSCPRHVVSGQCNECLAEVLEEETARLSSLLASKTSEAERCTDCGLYAAETGHPGDTTRLCGICLEEQRYLH